MAEYSLFMRSDAGGDSSSAPWEAYLDVLGSAGVLRGGSAIGSGVCLRRRGAVPSISDHIAGFVRIDARDLDHVRDLSNGNPVFEAGGTIEVRELPRPD